MGTRVHAFTVVAEYKSSFLTQLLKLTNVSVGCLLQELNSEKCLKKLHLSYVMLCLIWLPSLPIKNMWFSILYVFQFDSFLVLIINIKYNIYRNRVFYVEQNVKISSFYG